MTTRLDGDARAPLAYLDLDVWLSRRPDGRHEAVSTRHPRLCLVDEDVGTLQVTCARAFAMHATTEGHDARFVMGVSLTPPGIRYRGPRLPPGYVHVGRLTVTDVVDGGGRSLLPSPWDPDDVRARAFLSPSRPRAPGCPRPPRTPVPRGGRPRP